MHKLVDSSEREEALLLGNPNRLASMPEKRKLQLAIELQRDGQVQRAQRLLEGETDD